MRSFIEIVLWNSAIATPLAVLAMIVGRYVRRPAVVHGLWLLVLLKLVTPPLVRIPLAVLGQQSTAEFARAAISEEPLQADARRDVSPGFVDPNGRDASIWENGANGNADRESDRPSFQDTGRPDKPAAALRTANSADALSDGAASVTLAAKPAESATIAWTAVISGIWAAGASVVFAITFVRVLRFRRHVGRHWPTDPNVQREADVLAKRFGLSRAPRVKVVNGTLPPLLWSMLRPPVIFLPRTLVERLAPQQLQTVLAHELAHLRRHDNWVRWIEVLVLGLYWWHPVAWIAKRRLQRSEEECCDAWVLWALPDAAAVYARTILETVDFLTAGPRPSPALVSGLGSVHVLERRFEMILHTRPAHRAGLLMKCTLMLLALVVLPLSARAQHEPTSIEAAPASANQQATSQVRPAATPAPTEPVAPAIATSTAPPGPDLAPQVQGTAFTPSVGTAVSGSNATEDRLSRLEKMVQMIVAEMHGQQHRDVTWAARNKIGSSSATGAGNETVTLSDLKKQRIDLEDELESIKDRMDKVDAQIAKLQSARSPQNSINGLQTK